MRIRLLAVVVLGLLSCAVPARAELVFFASGQSFSVKSHRVDGESLVLALRSGGEIVCERSVITKIEPDEVPYPEAEAAVAQKPDPADGASAGGLLPDPRYAELIDKLSAEHGVPPRLVNAVIRVESGYQERARSRKGAMGLMQLMPVTARQYAVADPYDARENIAAGIKHLKSLLDRLPLKLALAAYNAGETTVQRYRGVPPYAETRDYVTRVLKLAQ